MDSFFGIGLFELVMIAVIALLVLGPERLPGAMREVSKYMKQLRNVSNEFQSQFSDELKMLDEMNPRKILNEAIDPNASRDNSAGNGAKPPAAAATPATTAAAKVSPASVKPVTATAKPLTPKPVTPPAPTISNGEPEHTILPPQKAEPDLDLSADSLPPVGSLPPADVDLPPAGAAGNITGGSAQRNSAESAAPDAEASP